MFLDQGMDGGPAGPDEPGDVTDVAFRLFESFGQHPLLRLLPGPGEIFSGSEERRLLPEIPRSHRDVEVDGGHEAARGDDHGPPDPVLHLPDVPGPVVGRNQGETVLRKVDDVALLVFESKLLEKVPGKEEDVLPPLPKGRKDEAHDADPVVEVLPEAPLRHHLGKRLVGGGDDPHVELLSGPGPDPLHDLVLEHPKKFHLEVHRKLGHLVQKQCPVVRRLELSSPALGGSGKSPLLMAEELAFHQVLRDRPAVDGDEGTVLSGAGLVAGPGEELLACSALAGDQDRDVGGGDLSENPEHLADLLVLRHDPQRGRRTFWDDLGKRPGLSGKERPVVGPGDHPPELLWVYGLLEEVVGTEADRLKRPGTRDVPAQNDSVERGIGFGEESQEIDPVLARVLTQGEVEHRHCGSLAEKEVNGRGSGVRGEHGIVGLEEPAHLPKHRRVVVHDEKRRRKRCEIRFGQRSASWTKADRDADASPLDPRPGIYRERTGASDRRKPTSFLRASSGVVVTVMETRTIAPSVRRMRSASRII